MDIIYEETVNDSKSLQLNLRWLYLLEFVSIYVKECLKLTFLREVYQWRTIIHIKCWKSVLPYIISSIHIPRDPLKFVKKFVVSARWGRLPTLYIGNSETSEIKIMDFLGQPSPKYGLDIRFLRFVCVCGYMQIWCGSLHSWGPVYYFHIPAIHWGGTGLTTRLGWFKTGHHRQGSNPGPVD